METLLTKIGSWLITPFILLASLFGGTIEAPLPTIDGGAAYVKQTETAPLINVGAALPTATGVFETSLATPITSSATSMTLVTNAIRGGGSISGYTCFTIDEGSAQAEVVCGTVSGTAVTSMTRGISYADGITSVAVNKFQHRRGANIKITDFPILQILKAQNNGEETFPNPLTYESGVGPVDSSDLADKEYVLSVVSGGTVSFDQQIISAIAGETISAGNLVYFDTTQNEWMKTDADTLATLFNVNLGIAIGSGTDGNAITGGVLVSGNYTTSGLTKGDIIYASNTAGAFSASVGTVPRVIGTAKDSTTLYFNPNFQNKLYEYATDAVGTDAYEITLPEANQTYYVGMEVAFKAGTANTGGATLAINGGVAKTLVKDVSLALVTGDILANQIVKAVYDGTNFQITSLKPLNIPTPTIQTYTTASTTLGDSTTRFDITNPAGTTFRYTWDLTGTDPGITTGTVPTGIRVLIASATTSGNIAYANTGNFIVTGSGTNYFEVTNASGTAENDKIIGTNGSLKTITAQTWTKPSLLKYIVVEGVGAGGGGGGNNTDGGWGTGGGGGGYFKKTIIASSLGATETIYVGPGGNGGTGDTRGFLGSTSYFGNNYYATGGIGGWNTNVSYIVPSGGIGVGADINLEGGDGGNGSGASTVVSPSGGTGGSSYLGGGGIGGNTSSMAGSDGNNYGGGGGGAGNNSSTSSVSGGIGAGGIIIVTEYY